MAAHDAAVAAERSRLERDPVVPRDQRDGCGHDAHRRCSEARHAGGKSVDHERAIGLRHGIAGDDRLVARIVVARDEAPLAGGHHHDACPRDRRAVRGHGAVHDRRADHLHDDVCGGPGDDDHPRADGGEAARRAPDAIRPVTRAGDPEPALRVRRDREARGPNIRRPEVAGLGLEPDVGAGYGGPRDRPLRNEREVAMDLPRRGDADRDRAIAIRTHDDIELSDERRGRQRAQRVRATRVGLGADRVLAEELRVRDRIASGIGYLALEPRGARQELELERVCGHGRIAQIEMCDGRKRLGKRGTERDGTRSFAAEIKATIVVGPELARRARLGRQPYQRVRDRCAVAYDAPRDAAVGRALLRRPAGGNADLGARDRMARRQR